MPSRRARGSDDASGRAIARAAAVIRTFGFMFVGAIVTDGLRRINPAMGDGVPRSGARASVF